MFARLSFMTEVTEADINLALTPIHTIVWAVSFAYFMKDLIEKIG